MRPLTTLLLLALALTARAEDKKPCVFCEIIAGRIPASVVYRDDLVIAFMDHAPVNPGHVLVVPVQHAELLTDVPPSTAGQMMRVAQIVARGIQKTDLKTEGIRVTLNSGKAAGQEVPHAHLHVVPHYAGDDRQPVVARAELDRVAEKIRGGLKDAGATAAKKE